MQVDRWEGAEDKLQEHRDPSSLVAGVHKGKISFNAINWMNDCSLAGLLIDDGVHMETVF